MNIIRLSADRRMQVIAPNISRFLMVIFALLITYFRYPRYFLQPRFWAEEGSRHFAFSYSHNWLIALFHPQIGYLNFWPNLATLLAAILPLESAPLVTTLMAMLVQLIPIVLILWSESTFWKGWLRKLVGILVFIFVPLSQEVWLNTINSYNYFAIITFLILLEDPPASPTRRWIYRTLLILAGLTGTLSCFLLPLFVIQWFKEKNKERLLQIFLLLICAAIQVYLIFSYSGKGDLSQRFYPLGFATFGATIWTQSMGLFVLGYARVSDWARSLLSLVPNNMHAFRIWGRSLFVFGMILFFLLSANLKLKVRILFISSYVILLLLPMMFSIIQDKLSMVYTGNHQRLFFAPNVLLGWMLLLGIRYYKGPPITKTNLISLFCTIILIFALFWGIKSYPLPSSVADYWPDWKSEVQIWKNNPDYLLHIQPNNWVVQLQQR
jgi:hypothetical protein